MNISIHVLKRRASKTLQNCMGMAILAILAEVLVTFIGAYLGVSLFSGTDVLNLVLNQVFGFVVSLIASVFSAGVAFLYLKMARNEPYSFRDTLYFFKNNPDRVIVVSFFLSLTQLVCLVPSYVYQYTALRGDTLEAQTAFLMRYLGVVLVGYCLYLVLTVPFAMSYYLLADDHGLEGLAAMKESMRYMRGRKGKYLLLLLSYTPALCLAVLFFYLPLIWVIPHMTMSETAFYLWLLNPVEATGKGFKHENPVAYVNPVLGGRAPVYEEATWEKAGEAEAGEAAAAIEEKEASSEEETPSQEITPTTGALPQEETEQSEDTEWIS